MRSSLREDVPEVGFLDDIYAIAEEYEAATGARPTDLSHWDPTQPFSDLVSQRLRLDWQGESIGYLYPYDLPERDSILRRLGRDPSSTACLVTPSGTVAAHVALRLLYATGCRTLTVVMPAYFPILYAARWYGFSLHSVPGRWDGRVFRLPDNLESRLQPGSAIWITHPAYSSGATLPQEDWIRLAALTGHVRVVCDECLCPQDRSAAARGCPDWIALHTPHKALLMNAVKFAAVSYPRALEPLGAGITDVVFGGLPRSALLAVRHFLGENFERLSSDAGRELRSRYARVCRVVESFDTLRVDEIQCGPFVSCYAPALPHALGHDLSLLAEAIHRAGTVFIPGARSGFPPECGLSLRVNLGRMDDDGLGALGRVCEYLQRLARHGR